MARLHFYFHTIQSGGNQTTMRIAGPAKTMGMYNGSALSILGHNPDFDNARLLEVAVFSGSLEAIHC
ncbi:hypothetical protein POTOM_012815 [Populus tomentosa]|uniref:Dirigent protein n=1 Tax=Populus tomentosa TaxID=118781 RepID=A0A8X8A5W5_POPTO|nr:hypothetical protein POTOM_012815 [Populus tomentosa]